MGVDIHGWVEMKAWYPDEWIGVLRIDAIIGRHIHGFGSMFLDEGIDFFQPVAKGRGLPNDVSEEVKRGHPEEDWGHTWAFWHEIATIDWDAVYTPPSPRVYKYMRDVSGDIKLDFHEVKDPPSLTLTHEGDIDIGETKYRVIRHPSIRRDEMLDPGWQIVFNAMQFIINEEQRGNENVRIVVWFNG